MRNDRPAMSARVFSVGSELPGGVAEHVPLRSEQSLFDGDVVLFWPHFGDYMSSDWYSGHRLLTESHSVRVQEDVAHWRSELKTAVENGKVVFVFMKSPQKVYYDTGARSHSGTGRSRITTRHVDSIESYDCLPFALNGLTPRSGKEISVISELGPMAAYWHEFGSMSAYEAYYEPGQFRAGGTRMVSDRQVRPVQRISDVCNHPRSLRHNV